MAAPSLKLVFHPLAAERWPDLEQLFGERGACGGCWCMAWRLRRAEFEKGKGAANKRALQRLVSRNHPPGILAYHDSQAIGWCAIAPREEFSTLARSRVLAPVDEQKVWSITCLFVARPYRRHGVSVRLLRAAAEFAHEHGGTVIEGYPVEPYTPNMPAAFAWTGLVSAFRKAGFREVARRSNSRPIVRLERQKRRARQAT
jgi:GNAT superfamily N-acetyltransferase